MTRQDTSSTPNHSIDRRTLLKYSAATGAALSLGVKSPVIAQTRAIKLGYVSPLTGPLAAFAEADNFIIANFKEATKAGIKVGNATVPVEVIVKDSQSNPNRAAAVAKDLIVQDKIDLMLVASTPETTNPVSTQCEIEEVPCISTVAPWQPWFIGRQANPAGGPPAWKGFNYTYHFFWGLEDVIAVFTNMWGQVATNKSVGGLFPNDGDGNAWGDQAVGFPPVLDKGGYKLTDPGRYQNLTDNFSAQIGAFKIGQWRDRHRRGAAAGLHDILEAVAATGVQAEGRLDRQGDPVSRLPSRRSARTVTISRRKSGGRRAIRSNRRLSGMSAKDLAGAYEAATKKQWTQPIGFVACAVRGRRRCAQAGAGSRSQGDRRDDCRNQSRHRRRQGGVGWRQPAAVRGQERRENAAGRRPVAVQGRQIRYRHHRQQDGAGDPRRWPDGGHRLIARRVDISCCLKSPA